MNLELDDNLRVVLRTGRHKAKLSQITAAARAGISGIWWAKLETGTHTMTTQDTFIKMIMAVHVPSRVLKRAGYPSLALALEEESDWFAGDVFSGLRAVHHPLLRHPRAGHSAPGMLPTDELPGQRRQFGVAAGGCS
jgi:hypothetical protein